MNFRMMGVAVMLAALLAGCATSRGPQGFDHDPALYTQIDDPVTDPVLANVCHLQIQRTFLGNSLTPATGTAVLYRGRYLVTAGHNIFQDRSGIAYVDIRCGVGEARDTPVQQRVYGWQLMDAGRYDPRFVLAGMPYEWDYGVIRLNEPIATEVTFTLSEREPATGEQVMLAGYPGGMEPYRLDDGWQLYTASAEVGNVSRRLFDYNIRTYTSNSGGPVWQMRDGRPHLVGIHVKQGGARLVNLEFRAEILRLTQELDDRAEESGVE